MPKRKTAERPNDERVRFMGGRAPDARAEAAGPSEPIASDPHILQSRPDPLGRCRVTVGFELVSCATPARLVRTGNAERAFTMFPGEEELESDTRVALAPFVAEMREDAALMAEYAFNPVGAGSVEVRFRLLIETPAMPLADALDEALRARDELGVCLRVLAGWYAFAPVQFRSGDRVRWQGKKVRLRVQPRLFTGDGAAPIGFATQGRKGGGLQILLPQPAAGDEHFRQSRNGPQPLLLESSRRCCLKATIRAARGLTSPLAIRVGLRRRNFDVEALAALQANPGSLSAAAHGEPAGPVTATGTGRAREAAQQAVDQLIMQPEGVELFVETDGSRNLSLALLRILGRELVPDFAAEVTESTSPPSRRPTGRRTTIPIDLSQLFAPGAVLPPLLPAPSELEALSFPRHFPNPTVMFPRDGLHLGRAQIGGVVVDVRMPQVDRSRHTYVLGATGTGKSTLLYNMAVQDMNAGHGLAVIDPHGDLYEQLLLAVPPERKGDLILIDPEEDRFCPGLNPMDFGGKPNVEGVSRVANDMLDIFESLYDMRQAGGPGFEDYFRNSMLLAAAAPRGGPSESDGPVPSFASIPHVLREADWRKYCLGKLEQAYGAEAAEQITRFFKMAEATTGDQKFANWAPYISSKLTRFVTNATLRKMFCKGRKTLDFRTAMDQSKIVLVNLGKGDLGSSDSRVIGMLLTKYLFQAALSRSDLPRDQRLPFYFYLDEFQNFVATDIPEMLAESRKYGLHMVLANQTLGQLMQAGRRETLDAVLGNVATKLFLRVGLQEAGAVAAGFGPYFDAETLTQLPDRHVLCRLQMKGQPSLPFVFETIPPLPAPMKATVTRSMGWAWEAQPSQPTGAALAQSAAAAGTVAAKSATRDESAQANSTNNSDLQTKSATRATEVVAAAASAIAKIKSRRDQSNTKASAEPSAPSVQAASSDTLKWMSSVARTDAVTEPREGAAGEPP